MKTLAEAVREAQRRFWSEPEDGAIPLRHISKTQDVLPVLCDLDAFVGMRDDGSILWYEYEAPHTSEHVDPHPAFLVTIRRSELHPELETWKPTRDSSHTECPACSGAGEAIPNAPPSVACFCGGVGWVPKTLASQYPRE